MDIVDIVKYIIYGLYILVSFGGLVVSFVIAIKEHNYKKAQEIYNITATAFRSAADNLVSQAENFKNYTGEEKLNWVLTRLKELNQNLYGEGDMVTIVNAIVKEHNEWRDKQKGVVNGGK